MYTTQKLKFSIKYFFSKCDQIHSLLKGPPSGMFKFFKGLGSNIMSYLFQIGYDIQGDGMNFKSLLYMVLSITQKILSFLD